MKKSVKIGMAVVLILVLLISCGVYWAFYDIQRIQGQELLCTVDSPSGDSMVQMYRNNGGATTSYAVLGTVVNKQNQHKRNFYWKYPCETADVHWVDETTVEVNEVQLQVWKDHYRQCK